ncbi:PREDICTED: uncharacterized protein LOC102019780 [Chinchilla lanigera]|uniref:uncharacterized protein LOC102019780 n=1 Tax=Chinchilla lanigera TaxID=34839 RepID=UPI00038EAC1D|nr:PREDICTED: uncharacterized protein LOC102019780 [Chinchilla lanigera]
MPLPPGACTPWTRPSETVSQVTLSCFKLQATRAAPRAGQRTDRRPELRKLRLRSSMSSFSTLSAQPSAPGLGTPRVTRGRDNPVSAPQETTETLLCMPDLPPSTAERAREHAPGSAPQRQLPPPLRSLPEGPLSPGPAWLPRLWGARLWFLALDGRTLSFTASASAGWGVGREGWPRLDGAAGATARGRAAPQASGPRHSHATSTVLVTASVTGFPLVCKATESALSNHKV